MHSHFVWVNHLHIKNKNSSSNNKNLVSVTSLLVFGKIFRRTHKNLHVCICTGLHVPQVMGKFIEMKQKLTDCKVNLTTKMKGISSLMGNEVYERKNAPQNLLIEVLES